MEAPTIESHATSAEREQVMTWLREFNEAENGEFMNSLANGAEQDLFMVARDGDGAVTGGLQGTLLHRWLKIGLMAVSPGRRGQGIGRSLVCAAEDFASRRGCQYSYVDTMSYQAPAFYSELGYCESGRLKDWDSHGHDKVFFTKSLPTIPMSG